MSAANLLGIVLMIGLVAVFGGVFVALEVRDYMAWRNFPKDQTKFVEHLTEEFGVPGRCGGRSRETHPWDRIEVGQCFKTGHISNSYVVSDTRPENSYSVYAVSCSIDGEKLDLFYLFPRIENYLEAGYWCIYERSRSEGLPPRFDNQSLIFPMPDIRPVTGLLIWLFG